MMASKVPIVKDLVLLGGGHSHVEVLRSFGMRPMPGVRVTLVTRDVHTPYSGMLPGYISGFYTFDDCHIDLAKLTSWAQTRLVHAEATGLDIQKRRILFAGRPPLAYDVLSVDIGITPDSQGVPGARQHTVPVKPIDRFVSHLDLLLSRHAAREQPMRLVVVGGGAGGVEVTLSMLHRLEQERVAAGRPASQQANISVVCRGPLLGSHTGYARRSFLAVLAHKGVTLHEDCDVERVEAGALVLRGPAGGAAQAAGGQEAAPTRIEFDECLWCTQASPAAWLKATQLPTDASGFLAINECLQSDQGPPEVFAAGDVASCAKHPRPKAGVYAVRQGPPLAANLRHYLAGEPLQPFIPQATNLALITTGDKYCVGTKGWLGLQGAYLWYWKDSIDRAFMRKYGEDLEVMRARMMAQQKPGSGSEAQPSAITAAGPEALTLLAESKMRCGGCGAKVGASVLSRALARLPPGPVGAAGIVAGLDSPDDAAILRPPPAGKLLLQTVDFLRSFCQDAYEFGQVVANHALGDVWAMGGRPTSALAVVVLPLMTEALMEEELTLLMAGAHKVLTAAGCSIVGGHTCEGAELSLGFSVTGEVDEGRVLRKNGLKAGQALVLTKGLGVGVIMAAHMRCKAKGRHVTGALASMIESSQEAAALLLAHGATAATDVTGFGLVGHLVEMTRPSGVSVTLDWRAVPWLAGAADALQEGVTSSIHTQNAKAAAAIGNFQQLQQAEPVLWPILVDPQTGGGLLAGIPEDQAHACVKALQAAGYAQACVVGHVTEPGTAPITVSL